VSNAIEAQLPSSSAGLRRVDLGRPEFGTMARADGSVRRFSLIAVIPACADLRGPSASHYCRSDRIGCGPESDSARRGPESDAVEAPTRR